MASGQQRGDVGEPPVAGQPPGDREGHQRQEPDHRHADQTHQQSACGRTASPVRPVAVHHGGGHRVVQRRVLGHLVAVHALGRRPAWSAPAPGTAAGPRRPASRAGVLNSAKYCRSSGGRVSPHAGQQRAADPRCRTGRRRRRSRSASWRAAPPAITKASPGAGQPPPSARRRTLLTCCGSSGLRKFGVTMVQNVISARKSAVAVQATGLPPGRVTEPRAAEGIAHGATVPTRRRTARDVERRRGAVVAAVTDVPDRSVKPVRPGSPVS